MIDYITNPPAKEWQNTWPRSVSLLGSTGSIGSSTLDVIRLHPDRFRVVALAGARNLAKLAAQAIEFRPAYLAVLEEKDIPVLRGLMPGNYSPVITHGSEGYKELATLDEADIILSAQVGAAGLSATAAAAGKGKVIALANKESLVLAGSLIRRLCRENGASILPVDSEHNAIFQCVYDSTPKSVSKIILTASGGPFFGKTQADLEKVTREDALKHPNWTMGAKITIDSATMMNKGLEVIEAFHLYGTPLADIEVLIHRQSIVHSLVSFADGSHLAHLGVPDMRIAIAYCLSFPDRVDPGAKPLDLTALGNLNFNKPDLATFPCLNLAREAQAMNHGAPIVLNAANEIAVEAFLEGCITFTGIPHIVEKALEGHAKSQNSRSSYDSVEDILALDWATRAEVMSWGSLAKKRERDAMRNKGIAL